MRLTRPLLLLALAALMAPRAAASRTSVWESNPPAAVLTSTSAAGLLAPLAPAGPLESIAAAVEPVEPLRFDLGDVVLVENLREDGFRIGLADVVEPPALRGPPLLDGDPHHAFELCDPENRIRGLDLLPPFGIGASPSLSLWPHQACGFSCREVASDSRYDPWGLAVSVTKKGVMIASEELLHSPIEHFSWDWAAEHPDQFYALLTKRGGMNELEAGKLMADNGVMPGGQAGREFFVRQVSRDSRQLEDDATELWTSGMLGLGVDRAVTAAGRKVAATVAERQLAKEAAKRGGTPRINLADPRPSSPAPAAPVGTSSKGNYRPRFIAASETPADDEVHHTLFQKYATEFRSIGVNIHEERFLRGVNELVHRQVTKRVARLERQLNRRLTTDEVLDLAAKFDAEYGTQFVHRTPPARTERP